MQKVWRAVYLVAYLAAVGSWSWSAARAEPAQTGGFDLFRMRCDGCHDLPDPERPRRSRTEWEGVLRFMVDTQGVDLTPTEFTAVLNYLASASAPPAAAGWVETPATSREVTFQQEQAGRPPEGWLPQAFRAAQPPAWTVRLVDEDRKPVLAPQSAVQEGEQALLIHNIGLLNDGTLKTRLRLAGGAEGAGIIFGYRDAHAYYGVRLAAPGTAGVALFEATAEGTALLGRASTRAPVGDWVELSVKIDGKSVAVEVNGEPAFTRTVEEYQGGRVGLATLGDSSAWFERWSVSVPD